MSKEENKFDESANNPDAVEEQGWGESSNYGYESDEERKDKRGLEDWELLHSMEESTVGIPFWFVAIFIVLLLVAVGLTFPFWGNRPGYERPWFDWGIPAGVAWVVVMSFIIYYFVEVVPARRLKQEAKDKEAEAPIKDSAEKNNDEN